MLVLILIFISSLTLFLFLSRNKKKPLPLLEEKIPTIDSYAEELETNNETYLADLGYDNQINTPSMQQTEFKIHSPRDLLMIYLIAPENKPFEGHELVLTLLNHKLRHGPMGLFHSYDEQGNILFSIAQATESGEFDLSKIKNLTCRGLLLFMQPQIHNASTVLNKLFNTGTQLAKELNGQLEDIHHQPFTKDTFEHYQKILNLK